MPSQFVWPGVVRDWTEPRCTLESVVGDKVTLSTRCALLLNGMKTPLPPPVRVEAAPPEGPLAQGVFWHDAEKEVRMLLSLPTRSCCFCHLC